MKVLAHEKVLEFNHWGKTHSLLSSTVSILKQFLDPKSNATAFVTRPTSLKRAKSLVESGSVRLMQAGIVKNHSLETVRIGGVVAASFLDLAYRVQMHIVPKWALSSLSVLVPKGEAISYYFDS